MQLDDTICSPCQTCTSNQWSPNECTSQQNKICLDCTTCENNQFMESGCTPTRNRVCSNCTECHRGQRTVEECTISRNAVCEDCNVCGLNQYRTGVCNNTQEFECHNCTMNCDDGFYRQGDCQPHSFEDHTCHACSACDPEIEWMEQNCTALNDTVCVGCARDCTEGITWESQPCSIEKQEDRVCTKCTQCVAGQEWMNATHPCTVSQDQGCLNCTACPEGQVKLGGCDGIDDNICGPPNDFVGTVSTGKPDPFGEYPLGCTCDDVSVGYMYKSISMWFFDFLDNNSAKVFSQPMVVDAPCVNNTCPLNKPFREKGGFSLAKMPASVGIKAIGLDGWCMSRVCVSSKQLGKRFVWNGMQWMNPGGEGDNEVCSGLPWPQVPLVEENYGDCDTNSPTFGANHPDTDAPTGAPTASPTPSVAPTPNNTGSDATAISDDTEGCQTCKEHGNGFYTLGCGQCQDEAGATPKRFKSSIPIADCRLSCEAAPACIAYEGGGSDDDGSSSSDLCYIYFSAGSPDQSWTEEAGSDGPVTKVSNVGKFTSGCNIRGAADNCVGATVDSAQGAADAVNITAPSPSATPAPSLGTNASNALAGHVVTPSSAQQAVQAVQPTAAPTNAPNGTNGGNVTSDSNLTSTSTCNKGHVSGEFWVLDCGRCEDKDGGIPRRFLKSGTSPSECRSACTANMECGGYEVNENGEQECYVYFESGSPGIGWGAENEDNVQAISQAPGEGYATGCHQRSNAEEVVILSEVAGEVL